MLDFMTGVSHSHFYSAIFNLLTSSALMHLPLSFLLDPLYMLPLTASIISVKAQSSSVTESKHKNEEVPLASRLEELQRIRNSSLDHSQHAATNHYMKGTSRKIAKDAERLSQVIFGPEMIPFPPLSVLHIEANMKRLQHRITQVLGLHTITHMYSGAPIIWLLGIITSNMHFMENERSKLCKLSNLSKVRELNKLTKLNKLRELK